MGVYDRDYYRDDGPGIRLGAASNWSAVGTIIVINVAVFLAQMFTAQGPAQVSWIEQTFALQSDLFQHPWQAWQLLTYGFVHANLWHILFNMIALYVFGYEVENVYGKREFYKLYISLIILAGLFNVALQSIMEHARPGMMQPSAVVGASGGIMGTAVIFACNFPRRLLYIWGVLPVPRPTF